MDFRVLGQVEVYAGQRRLDVGAPRNRTVLALLLAHAGKVVSVDYLVDELWLDRAPDDARLLAQGYISRLRRAFRAGPGGDSAAQRLVTRRPGYVLLVEENELDLHRFEDRVARARQAGQPSRALDLYREAQREWTSAPFDDAPPTRGLEAESARLSELRLRVLEEQFDLELSIGNEARIVPELTKYVAEYPLHGRLVRQLMVALYRCSRTADALSTYTQTKARLAHELGLDPPLELAELHLAILRDDPTLRNDAVPRADPVQRADRADNADKAGSAGSQSERVSEQPRKDACVDETTRTASTSEAPTSRKQRYHAPAYNLRRQYLTAYPDPVLHKFVDVERQIRLASGHYSIRQFMGDADDNLAEACYFEAGYYSWHDLLRPSSSARYRHETTLTPEALGGEGQTWSGHWTLSDSGIYTWGSMLDPEF